jgi:hypothetical protein
MRLRPLILLGVALLVPVTVRAETWRWCDAEGHLHYSNVAELVPAGAATITTNGDGLLLERLEPLLAQAGGARPHRAVECDKVAPRRVWKPADLRFYPLTRLDRGASSPTA